MNKGTAWGRDGNRQGASRHVMKAQEPTWRGVAFVGAQLGRLVAATTYWVQGAEPGGCAGQSGVPAAEEAATRHSQARLLSVRPTLVRPSLPHPALRVLPWRSSPSMGLNSRLPLNSTLDVSALPSARNVGSDAKHHGRICVRWCGDVLCNQQQQRLLSLGCKVWALCKHPASVHARLKRQAWPPVLYAGLLRTHAHHSRHHT